MTLVESKLPVKASSPIPAVPGAFFLLELLNLDIKKDMDMILIASLYLKGSLYWKYYLIHEDVPEFMDFMEKVDNNFDKVAWGFKVYGPFFKSHHFDENTNSESNKLKKYIKIFLLIWWLLFSYVIYSKLAIYEIW